MYMIPQCVLRVAFHGWRTPRNAQVVVVEFVPVRAVHTSTVSGMSLRILVLRARYRLSRTTLIAVLWLRRNL